MDDSNEFNMVIRTLRKLIDDMPADKIMEQIELQVEVDGILQNKPKEEALNLLKEKVAMLEQKYHYKD